MPLPLIYLLGTLATLAGIYLIYLPGAVLTVLGLFLIGGAVLGTLAAAASAEDDEPARPRRFR